MVIATVEGIRDSAIKNHTVRQLFEGAETVKAMVAPEAEKSIFFCVKELGVAQKK